MRTVFKRIFFIPLISIGILLIALPYISGANFRSIFWELSVVISFTVILSFLLSWKTALNTVEPIRNLLRLTRKFPNPGPFTRNGYSYSEIENLTSSIREILGQAAHQYQNVRIEKELLGILLNNLNEGILCIDKFGSVEFTNDSLDPRLVVPGCAGTPFFRAIKNASLLDMFQTLIRDSGPSEGKSKPRSIEIECGSSFFQINCTPVIVEDEIKFYILIFRDMTSEYETRKAREQFFENAGHELKTPLTSIRGYTETIQERSDDHSTIKFAEAILRNTERMERLIEDLTTISAIDAKRFRYQSETIELDTFLPDIASLTQGMLRTKNQNLNFSYSKEKTFQADRILMEHLLLNLISNASRYSPEQTTIEISMSERGGSQTVIEVADRGPGIATKYREKIFERFFRIDNDRNRSIGGTGLGLSIVLEITRLHGGTVSVDDNPPGGSIFRVVLPVVRA